MKNLSSLQRFAFFFGAALLLLSWSPLPVSSFAFPYIWLTGKKDEKTSPDGVTRKKAIEQEAVDVYSEMHLKQKGLSRNAFTTAWLGYKNLLEEGRLSKESVLTICDFSQSSRKKRLYIIDVRSKRLLMQTYVAHGRNSGTEYANDFSNIPSSFKSSLGFYVTENSYLGEKGMALNIKGMDKGFNDLAHYRRIVIHGADYVGSSYLRYNRITGRSLGCPAVPQKESQKIIQTIKNGSCFFIYHPSVKYLSRSTVLNS